MIFRNCYNLFSNTCDGSCQGCSHCRIARNFLYNDATEITRWQMIKDILGEIKTKIWIRKIFKELEKDEEFQNKMKELYKNIRDRAEEKVKQEMKRKKH